MIPELEFRNIFILMACRSHTETGHQISETHQILTFAGMPELLTLGHDVIYKGHTQNHTGKNFHLFGFVSDHNLSAYMACGY